MLLSIADLTKSYRTPEGSVPVIKGIDLQLDSTESLALTGETGSGKSTLLHLVGGLDKPDSGSITVNGQDIATLDDTERASYRRSRVGLIFQQFNLIPSLTVGDNLSFHGKLARRTDTAWETQLVRELGIEDLLRRYPEQLSGGQQQRVAIGRTLAARPPLVLADEPTSRRAISMRRPRMSCSTSC